jgi:endonuclease-8
MPEGDTLYQAAARLHAALAGQRITRFASPLPELKERAVEGHVVTRVRAHGKYLLLELDDGRALLSFLRMQGRWRVDAKRQLSATQLARAAREPRWDDELVSLIIETESSLAVLERAASAELAPLVELERQLASLGPDLLSEDFDLEEARRRLRSRGELSIAEALALQSLVAGIGNVYKSEILFLEKVSPFVSVSTLDDATLERLLRRARELMRRNRKGPRRTTFGTFASCAHYVYERSGQHCLKCDAKIRMLRQGALQRSTYFCPECQGVSA